MAERTLRIYISGGHSTGKTTILKDLLARVNIKSELDVARGLMQQLGKLDLRSMSVHCISAKL